MGTSRRKGSCDLTSGTPVGADTLSSISSEEKDTEDKIIVIQFVNFTVTCEFVFGLHNEGFVISPYLPVLYFHHALIVF